MVFTYIESYLTSSFEFFNVDIEGIHSKKVNKWNRKLDLAVYIKLWDENASILTGLTLYFIFIVSLYCWR